MCEKKKGARKKGISERFNSDFKRNVIEYMKQEE